MYSGYELTIRPMVNGSFPGKIVSVFVKMADFAAAETACLRVLEEFPDNEIVSSTLGMVRSRPVENEA